MSRMDVEGEDNKLPVGSREENNQEIQDVDTETDWPHHLLEYLPSGVLFEVFRNLDWNDLCSLSQTCTRFFQLCEKATLWRQLKLLDFSKVAVPLPEKILQILKKCPDAEHITLGDIVLEDLPMEDDNEENIYGVDRFMLDVLRQCTHLKSLRLMMHEISNKTIEAICAKCGHLKKLSIHDNNFISKSAVVDLLSYVTTLQELEIDNCENMMFPEIRTSVEGNSLKITKLCLTSITILEEHASMLLNNCKQLQVLDLSHSIHLAQFPTDVSPLQPSGLDTLRTLILKRCYDMKILQIVNAPRLCSVDISDCVALSLVHLACTEIKEVAANGCVSLKQFKLNPCVIENINLKELNALETLEINSDVLSVVNLSQCTRMTTDVLLNAFTQKHCIEDLNLTGCSNISPVDLNEKILSQFPNLESLHYGGHVWSSAEIKSQSLKNLQFGDCNILPCVPLNIPTLTNLRMFNCRDMTEQEMIDGFLYGKEIKKQRGIDKLIQENADYEPFKSGRGIPNLQIFNLHKMFGLHGDYISTSFSKFKHLRDVSIFSCPSLAHIFIDNCSNLKRFTVESCNRLSVCSFHRAPSLQTLVVKWCSMVRDFTAVLPSLQKLDVTGTNFASFSLDSDFLEILNLNGVCTQRDHKLFIRCPCLRELTLTKCDTLSDTVLADILVQMNQLKSITMSACPNISSFSVPGGVHTCSLTGHRRLKMIKLQQPINVQHLVLNNLAKFDPTLRLDFLKQCESSLKNLEVRAIPGEKDIFLDLCNLESLTLDQGIHLSQLEIACPKLKYLRIQGCPRLSSLTMHIDKLSHLQIFHSSPLLALKCMSLYVRHVKHLARVLTYYCPNLETLHLHQSKITIYELQSLGRAIPKLSSIILHSCDHDLSQQTVNISASDLGRNTSIPLQITNST